MFAYKHSNYECVKLMKHEAEVPLAYNDVIKEAGSPNKNVIDNAKVLACIKWTTINRCFCIEVGLTVPHHQHQTLAENCGGNFKLTVLCLLHNTPHASLTYWCYVAQFMEKSTRILVEKQPRRPLWL